jgi:hypothetical protein
MLTRLNRIIGLLLAVTFTANALAPGLMHGCGDTWRAEVAPSVHAEMAGMHHEGMKHQGKPGQSGHSHGCQCVGLSCCFTAVALPGSVRLPAVAAAEFLAGPGYRAHHDYLVRPDHLLPLAQAPPYLA